MLEACGDANLREKPIGADGGGNLRLQNLDCHLPAMSKIVGDVDDSHASGADDSVDVVRDRPRHSAGVAGCRSLGLRHGPDARDGR